MATGKRSLRERAGQLLAEFKENPQSVGFLWRLNLSDILVDRMSDQGCTQEQLAEKAGMKQPFVSRIINSDSNCTFDVAGRLLFALGVREGDIELRRKEKHVLKLTSEAATASSFRQPQSGITPSQAIVGQLSGAAHG